tara:strand:+ start:1790 stop:1975 length:186 start_codon:yes stop_codon:yes gene_type:complete
MLRTYFDQLIDLSETTGWDLRDACIDAGIADTTFYRWRLGITKPREKQAQIVAEFMTTYAR